MAIYKSDFKVRVADIDSKCQMKNRAILDVFQDVAGMHSDSVHLGINDIEKTKLSWIILNWKIKVFKRPVYNEKIVAKTWIREANKFFTYRDFELLDVSGNILAIGTSKWSLINIDTKKLIQIPEGIIDVYSLEDKKAFENEELKRLKEPEEYSDAVNYKILKKDIDINEHVHNIYYLDIAYEALPEDVYKQDDLNNVEIEYKLQIKKDDKIKAYYTKEKGKNIIAIKSDEGNVLHAIIQIY